MWITLRSSGEASRLNIAPDTCVRTTDPNLNEEPAITEPRNNLARLFAACWKDEALKARFLSEPKAVMKEFDLEMPEGVEVKVVENADGRVNFNIALPAAPAVNGDLSDDELSSAAGGIQLT